jgi:hypothetical protein
MGPQGLTLVLSDEELHGPLLRIDVEVVQPEVNEDLVELALAVDGAHHLGLLQLGDHLSRRPLHLRSVLLYQLAAGLALRVVARVSHLALLLCDLPSGRARHLVALQEILAQSPAAVSSRASRGPTAGRRCDGLELRHPLLEAHGLHLLDVSGARPVGKGG